MLELQIFYVLIFFFFLKVTGKLGSRAYKLFPTSLHSFLYTDSGKLLRAHQLPHMLFNTYSSAVLVLSGLYGSNLGGF